MANINDKFLAAIGSVTVEFATLEDQLATAVCWLLVGNELENQTTGRIAFAELSFKNGVHMFGSLFRHRFADRDDTELKSVCAELFKAEQVRNTIIHSSWALADEHQILRVKTTAKGKLKSNNELLTVTEIQAIASQIHSAAERLLNFQCISSGILGLDDPPLTL